MKEIDNLIDLVVENLLKYQFWIILGVIGSVFYLIWSKLS